MHAAEQQALQPDTDGEALEDNSPLPMVPEERRWPATMHTTIGDTTNAARHTSRQCRQSTRYTDSDNDRIFVFSFAVSSPFVERAA